MTAGRGRAGAAKLAAPTVTTVERSGAAVRLIVAIPGSPDLAVLASPRDGSPAWGHTRHLDLRYEGAVLSPEQARVLRGLAERLRDVPFEQLARNATGPVEAPAPSGGAPGAEGRDRTQEVVTVEEWGSPDRWRTFLFRREFDATLPPRSACSARTSSWSRTASRNASSRRRASTAARWAIWTTRGSARGSPSPVRPGGRERDGPGFPDRW